MYLPTCWKLIGGKMRHLALSAILPFILLASPSAAQASWQFDPEGVDGPTAFIADGDYTAGGICDSGTLYFFVDFPRDLLPKREDGNVRVKFATDIPEDMPTFDVQMVTVEWSQFGELASAWFHGDAADEWVGEMSTARRNAFVAVEVENTEYELIFEHFFTVAGSTAAISELKVACAGNK